MARHKGLSARAKFALSYAGFLMIGSILLTVAVWAFLARDTSAGFQFPSLSDFAKVFDPTSRGPVVFVPAAIMVLGFMLVLGLVGGWILAGHMLAPLSRITEATRTAARGSLSHRINLKGGQDEFRELADAFDGMLARLEAHVAEQQRFAANASHELRTPLAISQTLLDVARKDPVRADDAIIERLSSVNARAIELTEALLMLSRSDQRTFAREDVDLSLVAEESAETLLPLAEKRGVTIHVSGDIATTIGSPTLLLQLATNLMHNAIVHNHPMGGTVEVHTSVVNDVAILMVENTGEKLSPMLVSTLAEPFQRGTQRVHEAQAGVGLGLSIVKNIAQTHDGTLTLSPRDQGGLRATVRLPRSGRSNPRSSTSAHVNGTRA